jgi:hypothetical protein
LNRLPLYHILLSFLLIMPLTLTITTFLYAKIQTHNSVIICIRLCGSEYNKTNQLQNIFLTKFRFHMWCPCDQTVVTSNLEYRELTIQISLMISIQSLNLVQLITLNKLACSVVSKNPLWFMCLRLANTKNNIRPTETRDGLCWLNGPGSGSVTLT